MGTCWYCHWGWPKSVADIYLKALAKLDGNWYPLHFGPAHIVWEDENFDCADLCLEQFDDNHNGYSDSELEIVRQSLKELAELPADECDIEPEEYDGDHPELYPPPKGVVVMQVAYGKGVA